MKRKFLKCLGIGFALSALLCGTAGAEDLAGTSINVYNWGQYISDGSDGYIDVNKAFTEATGIKVNYMTFDTNESLYTKMKTGGSTYDIVIPSDYMIGRMIDEDMLTKIDWNNVPNAKYIDEAYKNMAYDPNNEYSAPYTWGTVGVIYNKKYVNEADLGSWDLLWNSKYAGKILMFDNSRDAFAIAESKLGYSLNTQDETELKNAAEELAKQKPLVQSYVMDQIFDKMEREEAWIAPYYAGDYLLMKQENPDLGFYFPKEGFNFFIDAICIPKDCENKAGAEAYINFLCSPEISGENLDYLGYSTPISEAKQYMDPETSASEIAYPAEETLSQGESFLYLSKPTTKLMDSLWLKVKTTGSNTKPLLILTITAIVVVLLLAIGMKIRRKRRMARRCRYFK